MPQITKPAPLSRRLVKIVMDNLPDKVWQAWEENYSVETRTEIRETIEMKVWEQLRDWQ